LGKAQSGRGTSFSSESVIMTRVAKVALVSSLPQLDRLFDYEIPLELQEAVQTGSRVQVPFGKSTKPYEGFVFEVGENSSHKGSLAKLIGVLGANPALPIELLDLVQKLSIRSASGVGEILKLAVPANMPRSVLAHGQESFKPSLQIPSFSSSTIGQQRIASLSAKGSRHAVLTKPGEADLIADDETKHFPSWVVEFCLIAASNLRAQKSTLLLVPDYRDQATLLSALEFLNLMDFTANYSQEQTKSKVFRAYLRALDSVPRIVYGSRAAMFAPAYNLGTIAIFDESDASYTDQSSPYLNSRDVLLLRQSIQDCAIVFTAHSRSTDIQRLVETGYLTESNQVFARPKVSISEQGFRVDTNAFRAIKKGLASGSVLVQVAAKGDSSAIFCTACNTRVLCAICSGPIWIDQNGLRKCRWCNNLSQDIRCLCGAVTFSSGRAGSTRTSSELGRAFPGARVVESTGDNRIVSLPSDKTLVIATAGAEPYVQGGYAAVVVLDGAVLLSRQSLRATEDAIRLWANAVSRLGPGGEAVLVGVAGDLAQQFALWQLTDLAAAELATRKELNLPPTLRLGSVSGSFENLSQLAASISEFRDLQAIGPAPFAKGGGLDEWRLIFKYPYSAAIGVASFLSLETSRISSGKVSVSKSGRNTRLLKVRMNDAEVI
jgi:primosomal protein N' (replication factor Y)